MMYDFFIGMFVILGIFGALCFLADYILPALFGEFPLEWDDEDDSQTL